MTGRSHPDRREARNRHDVHADGPHREVRSAIVEAGRRLVDEGLVARTWGNISVSISTDEMLITPSGRPYESLRPEEIVTVGKTDLSFRGPLKPSSEKNMHVAVYRIRPGASAVVHTHQPAASSFAAARRGFAVTDPADVAVLGRTVPCVPYALPTTKRLARRVATTVAATPDARAFLLANHGAVCLGATLEEALHVTTTLERAAEHALAYPAGRHTGTQSEPGRQDDIRPRIEIPPYDEPVFDEPVFDDPVFDAVTTNGNNADRDALRRLITGGYLRRRHELVFRGGPVSRAPSPLLRLLHDVVDANGPATTAMIVRSPYTCAAAAARTAMYPLLDDMAQLIGPSLRCTTPHHARRGLRRRAAVLLSGEGALAAAPSLYELASVAMVVEKSCRAHLESARLGGGRRIPAPEAHLMRLLYRFSYRKHAEAGTGDAR